MGLPLQHPLHQPTTGSHQHHLVHRSTTAWHLQHPHLQSTTPRPLQHPHHQSIAPTEWLRNAWRWTRRRPRDEFGCTGNSPQFRNQQTFCAVGGVPDRQKCVRPPSPNVEDTSSEHSGVEGRRPQLESENKILLGQGVVTKQTILTHAVGIRKVGRTVRAICEWLLEPAGKRKPQDQRIQPHKWEYPRPRR